MMASNTLLRQQRREMGLYADVDQVLENDVKRRNEVAYDFVGDVVRANLGLTFPSMSVISPNLILPGWISGSKESGRLVLLWQWAGLYRRIPLRCSRFRW